MNYAKAIVGAVIAGLGAASTALINDGHVTGMEVGVIIGAVVAALGAVYAVPNKP